MTAGRLKLVGQVAAIGLVAGLLVLLIWKVAGGSESEVEGLRSGKTPPAPGFNLPRLDGRREDLARFVPWQGRRA